MFGDAVQAERDPGIEFWADTCPPVEGISVVVPHPAQPGAKVIDWVGRLERNAYLVDQRIKIPRWMQAFEKPGGRLVLKEASLSDMELYAREDDLVIVASGKGGIGRMFDRDASRSPCDSRSARWRRPVFTA